MKTKADCVILGGGVVGTAIAYYLAKMGVRDIVVLEAAYLASGATGRCGGGIRQQCIDHRSPRRIQRIDAVSRIDRQRDSLFTVLERCTANGGSAGGPNAIQKAPTLQLQDPPAHHRERGQGVRTVAVTVDHEHRQG